MEQTNTAPAEQTTETSGTVEKPQNVSFESHQKLLGEKKNLKARYDEMEKKLKDLEANQLHAEGKKDELLTNYKKRVDELEGSLSTTKKSFAWNTVVGEIKREALRQGCLNPEKLLRLMSDETLNSIEIDDNFSVAVESVKRAVEESKKENGFIFSSGSKAAAHGTPGKSGNFETKNKSEEELFASYIKNLK